MAEYTPSTGEVRQHYKWEASDSTRWKERNAEFDRWLEQVKADAWDEGYDAEHPDDFTGDLGDDNPYRQETPDGE